MVKQKIYRIYFCVYEEILKINKYIRQIGVKILGLLDEYRTARI